jgi:membrane protease YdiL (CAAX protease family)
MTDEAKVPPVRMALFAVFSALLLMLVIEGLWGFSQSKVKMLVLEAVLVVPAGIWVAARRASVREVFRLRPVRPSVLLLGGLIGVGLSVVTDECDRLLETLVPMPKELAVQMKDMVTAHSTSDLVVLVLAAVILAGVCEEMLFRGFLQGALERTTDATRAVLLSSLFFGMVHFNPWWFVEILILGFLLGVLAWKTRSIFPGAVAHGVNNAVALAYANMDPSRFSWYESGKHVKPLWVLLGLALIVGGFVLLYRVSETDESSATSPQDVS